MDATHIPLKRQTVSKEAVYIVIGIRLDGTKEVLGFSLAPTESAYVWKEILQDCPYIFSINSEISDIVIPF